MKRLLVLFVLLTACTITETPTYTYRTGTQGVDIKFLDPEPEVYTGTEMNLQFEIFNKGAYDLEDGFGKVVLSGYDGDAIKFSNFDYDGKYSEHALPFVMAKGLYAKDGGYDILEVTEDGEVSVPFGETYKPNIMATTCYLYETLASPTICVMSSVEEMKEQDEICRQTHTTMTDQGGPVAVTKVEEDILQQMLGVRITIENVGNGEVFDQNAFTECPFNLERTQKDIVDVSIDLVDSGEPICEPKDMRVPLYFGKGTIYCRIPIEMHTSYTAPLDITLDYGYTSSISRQFTLVNPPGYEES